MREQIIKAIEIYQKTNTKDDLFTRLVEKLIAEGKTQKEVYKLFLDVFKSHICVDGKVIVDEELDNKYLDILGRISGWCTKSASFFGQSWDKTLDS